MRNLVFALTATLGLVASIQAQQSPSPQPQPMQTAPCTGSAAAKTASTQPQVNLSDNTKQYLTQKQKFLQKFSPIALPDQTKLPQPAKPAPTPCPPPQPSQQLAPVIHLPIGVISTWLCNPIITSTDASHTTTFITPDALTSAEPTQASAFEADGAKADAKATVSCANLRRDPRNNKVFLAQ